MRLYPDLYSRRFAWMLADLLMVAWIYLSVQAGLWVNNLVLQLDALAQGVISAGKTFDSWILSFNQGIPNGVPYLSDFLHRTAEALKTHSGDPLISAGQAGSRGIHLLALILAIIVTSIPLLFALLIFVPRRVRRVLDTHCAQATTPAFVPTAPARTEDSGLPVARLADLLLKHIYFKSPLSAKDWAAALCLPYSTVTPAIQSLVEQGWCQTIGRMAGPAMSHDFGESLGYLISDPGRLRARDVLARDHYVGPAPVPFLQYETSVRAQVSQADVTAAWLTRALQHLTLSNDLLVQLGPPVNARAPLFLYGAPGNGKTTIAEACAELLGEPIYIPYAIDIEGQVMRLYDPLHHQRGQRQLPMNFDARWVLIKRPFVKAGGELTTAPLSPSFDPLTRYYEAPIQLKANGGVLPPGAFRRPANSPPAP